MLDKKFFYQMGSFNPDQSWIGTEGIGFVNNFMPYSGKYCFGPAMIDRTPIDLNYDGEILGITSINNGDNNLLYVAQSGGTAGYEIWRVTESSSDVGTETDLTDTTTNWTQSGAASADIEKWGVQFCTFGNKIMATDGNSGSTTACSIYWHDHTGTTDFTQLSPATGAALIKPKVIATHDGHLLAGNIKLAASWGGWTTSSDLSNVIWWSAFDNPDSFGSLAVTPELKGTDYKVLFDTAGGITQIVPAGDVVFVFKDKAIYIGDGPPYRWTLLTNNLGCQFPNSCKFYQNKVYFMSDAGPSVIHQDGTIENLLIGKAQRALIGTGSLFTT